MTFIKVTFANGGNFTDLGKGFDEPIVFHRNNVRITKGYCIMALPYIILLL